jgi:hypothetical protein
MSKKKEEIGPKINGFSHADTNLIFLSIANEPVVQGLVLGDLSTCMDCLFTDEQENSLRRTVRNLLISGYIPDDRNISLNNVNWTELTKRILTSFQEELEEVVKIGNKISSSPQVSNDDEESMYNY